MKFRKKPVVIDAIQFTGKNLAEILGFTRAGEISEDFLSDEIEIPTLEGVMKARPGDWIIRGIKGELYPCKPDIFAATYEAVNEATNTTPSRSGGE